MIPRIPTLLRRSGRFILALLIVFISWNAWYLCPPVPEFRFHHRPDLAGVTSNGSAALILEVIDAEQVLTVVHFATRRQIRIPFSNILNINLSPDGLYTVRGSVDGRHSLIDLTVNSIIADLPMNQVAHVYWSSDAQRFALAGHDRVLIARADNGATVADLLTASERVGFSPDSKCIGLVSADGRRFELWQLDPLERIDSIQLPCRVVPTLPFWNAKKEPDTAMVQSIAFSEDAGTIAVVLDRFQSDPHQPYGPGSLALTTSIAVSRRSVGIQKSFELGSCFLRGQLFRPEISPDGTWLAINDVGDSRAREESDIALLVEEPEHPGQLWDLSCNPPRCVKPWIDCTRPWNLGRRQIELLGNDRWLLTIDNDRQLVEARTESPRGGWKGSLAHPSRLIRGYNRSEYVADVVSIDKPNWPTRNLPKWMCRWLPTEDYATSIVRVADGRGTRILNGRRPVQFDVTGRLWTTSSPNGIAGDSVLERWSPEPAQPWWPIAGTMLALLVALWPRRSAAPSPLA